LVVSSYVPMIDSTKYKNLKLKKKRKKKKKSVRMKSYYIDNHVTWVS
jgi:hypothetical protein